MLLIIYFASNALRPGCHWTYIADERYTYRIVVACATDDFATRVWRVLKMHAHMYQFVIALPHALSPSLHTLMLSILRYQVDTGAMLEVTGLR